MKDSLIGPIAVCIFVLAGLVVTFYLIGQPSENSDTSAQLILDNSTATLTGTAIESESAARTIIYGSVLSDSEIQKAREDCAHQGGTFDSCGRACGDTQEVCLDVCAYTCTIAGVTF